jgi:hypothetical protein
MVSQRQCRRRSWLSLRRSCLAASWLLLGCSRRAEIEDAPDAGTVPTMEVPRPEGGIPLVEGAPLENTNGQSCAERPVQSACRGANDFGCDFDGWVQQLTKDCQVQTDCHTDGWVEVRLGPEGCATELRMEDPDEAYVACVSEQLREYSCPCAESVGSRFLGLAHDGCDGGVACGTGELRCPPGSTCEQGRCTAE